MPKGAPIFRWQEEDCTRDQALEQWRAQGGACITPLLTGCAFEVVLPDAYFAASREADKMSRPYSIQASVAFLSTTMDAPAANLRAVVAPFFERQVEEFRIGLHPARAERSGARGGVAPFSVQKTKVSRP